MKSLADALPPEIARQIHPDWRKNEEAYCAVRDQLLTQYHGQWIWCADCMGQARLDGRRRRRKGTHTAFPHLGISRWTGVSLPPPSRLLRQRADSGARCSEPRRDAVSGTGE